MEEKKKSNVGLIVLVVILLLACAGMGAFIFVNKNKLTAKENTTTTVESDKKDTNEKTETINNTIETRSCLGTYSGQGAVGQDVITGEKTNGTITVDLKEDGTYELTKQFGAGHHGIAGHYIIIENALLLKVGPDTCGPGADCSEKYASFLFIEDDCSKITGGYSSVIFDPDFTLTKNN